MGSNLMRGQVFGIGDWMNGFMEDSGEEIVCEKQRTERMMMNGIMHMG